MVKIQNFNIRTDLLYDMTEGFWLDVKGNTARIGMNPLTQETTGTFVAIQMKNTGDILEKGDSFGSVEAEKHVGHLKVPVSGKILSVNEKVLENPHLLNTDNYGEGWLIEIEMSRFEEEKTELLTGESNIINRFNVEITKFKEKGWLAES